MLVYCGHSYSCVFSPRPVTGSFTCTSKNHTINFFTLNIHAVLFEDNFALLITFYSYRTRTLTRLKPKMHSTQVLKATHNLYLVYNDNTHLSRSVLFVTTLQYIFSLRRISLFELIYMLKVLRYISLQLLQYKIANFHLHEILLNALVSRQDARNRPLSMTR